MTTRNLMCIVPASLGELNDKGVTSHILQRDLGGYWDQVITIHPFCKEYQITKLNDRHMVLEFPAKKILRTLWDLPGIARSYKITAVKAHDPYWMGLIAFVVAKVRRIPFTVGIYASYELMWKVERRHANSIIKSRIFDKVLAWFIFKMANRVQPGSNDAMKWSIKSGASRKKTSLVRTGGVDQVHFAGMETRRDLREELGLKNNLIVLATGRLVPVRTPQDVIKAFISIALWRASSVLLIVGDGSLRSEMEEIVWQYGTGEKVRFLGFQPQERLRDLMYTADVILTPLGGSGLVEACLSETPVVAYDVDWHREIVINGVTGSLVPYRDYGAMTMATIYLLEDQEKRTRLGVAARRKAITQHSLDKVQRDEIELFKELLWKSGSE